MGDSTVSVSPVAASHSALFGHTATLQPTDTSAAHRVTLSELTGCGMLNLRLRLATRGAGPAVRRALGFALPRIANTWTGGDGVMACWLGPDEWLIVASDSQAIALRSALEENLAKHWFALSDQSGGTAALRLSGPEAANVLAKGCTLDLSPSTRGDGQCAQTHIAKTGALIVVRTPGEVFDICVRRSFADYLWLWLTDAGREYGMSLSRDEGADL
jgi:sarcosine oxidase subunit gamma